MKIVDTITKSSFRMKRLVSDLLTYSRLGKEEKTASQIDINELIDDVIDSLEITIKEKNAEFKIDPMPTIMGEFSLFQVLFQNILSNALKYHKSATTPKIHISYKEIDRTLQFSIADNGLGIKPEYRGEVFQLFRRLHGRQQYKGVGIGLSMCKKIVEKLGGNIWVESNEPDGSIFKFTILK